MTTYASAVATPLAPRGENQWDGHSTTEKYERMEKLGR